MEVNKQRKRNKRLIGGVVALAVLVITIVGSNMFSSFRDDLDVEDTYRTSFSDLFVPKTEEKLIESGDENNRILVIPINGIIGVSGFGDQAYNHELILEGLEQAMTDLTINGIILQVDSPGGAVYEAAEVYRKIKEVQSDREDLPIYVSMGRVAASGGYYVSAPADKIYAAKETMTGSIGVISTYLNYKELADKVGIKYDVFKSGDHKDIGSSTREMTDEERAINQEMIDLMYNDFIDIIDDGRENLSRDQILKLADGRVYLGVQAVENGLIDELGYFEDVIEDMKDLIRDENEISDPEVFYLAMGDTLFDSYFRGFGFMNEKPELLDLFLHLESTGEEDLPNMYYLHGGY